MPRTHWLCCVDGASVVGVPAVLVSAYWSRVLLASVPPGAFVVLPSSL